jgi:hypothetical protein
MKRGEVVDRLNELLGSTDPETVNTSMRLPAPLREAAALAVKELDMAPSTTILTANALRSLLEAIVMQAALDEHYEKYPETKPTLADLAIVAAEMDGNPLAERPDFLRQAAAEITRHHPRAEPEDVLLWAEARAYAAGPSGGEVRWVS